MARPLHSSFTLTSLNGQQHLSFSSPKDDIVNRRKSFSIRLRYFEKELSRPATDYWRRRSQKFESLCKHSSQRALELEEDHRQLRKRIRVLEDRLSASSPHDATQQDDDDDDRNISVTPPRSLSLPTKVVTISKEENLHSCFYLTDGEGLCSDSDDCHYDDDVDDVSSCSASVKMTGKRRKTL